MAKITRLTPPADADPDSPFVRLDAQIRRHTKKAAQIAALEYDCDLQVLVEVALHLMLKGLRDGRKAPDILDSIQFEQNRRKGGSR
jgi:hypothetical protein